MSFRQQTSSFFDEMTKILNEKKLVREEDMAEGNQQGRPFSSQLTQDEEPTDHYNPAPVEEQEPDVVMRGIA